MPASIPRRPALWAAALLTATIALGACSPITSPFDAHPSQAQSWSSPYADMRNSSTALAALPATPTLRWSRDLGAPAPGPAVFDSNDSVMVSTMSAQGCNVFSFVASNSFKLWCSRQPIAGPRIAAQLNSFGDAYLPTLFGTAALSGEGEYRWGSSERVTSTTARQLNGQQVLIINTFGQARVLSTINGDQISPPLDLGGPVPAAPNDYGLPWCETGTRGCPAPAPAAIAADGTRFYLTVWPLGADTPFLVAVDVLTHSGSNPAESADPSDPDATATLQEAWRTPLPHGRTGAPVVLSSDGAVAYVASTQGLAAFNTADGAPRWYTPTNVETDFAPAISPDGLIVLGGRTGTFYRGEGQDAAAQREAASGGGQLVALRDRGDRAEELWRRDASALTAPVLSADNSVLIASRSDADGVTLRALRSDGEPQWDVEVPDARGGVSGVSLGNTGTIAIVMAIGRLYIFRAP